MDEQTESEVSEAALLQYGMMIDAYLQDLHLCWSFVQECQAKGRKIKPAEKKKLDQRWNTAMSELERREQELRCLAVGSGVPLIAFSKVLTQGNRNGVCLLGNLGQAIDEAQAEVRTITSHRAAAAILEGRSESEDDEEISRGDLLKLYEIDSSTLSYRILHMKHPKPCREEGRKHWFKLSEVEEWQRANPTSVNRNKKSG